MKRYVISMAAAAVLLHTVSVGAPWREVVWERDGNLITADVDGSNQGVLVDESATVHFPVFSHDYRRLAYVRQDGGQREICVMDLDGSSECADAPGLIYYSSWDADNERVYYPRNQGDGEIWTIDFSNAVPVATLFHDPPVYRTFGVAASPDGARLVMVHDPNNWTYNNYLSVYDFGTGTATTIYPTNGRRDFFPDHSPTRDEIAWSQMDATDHSDVWIIQADGTAPTQLTFSGGEHEQPLRFSPDGDAIYYGRGSDLWVVNRDGSGSQSLFALGATRPSFDVARIVAVCGDGIVDADEECDDGNTVSGDGCSESCVIEFCGDGIVNLPGETCDPPGDAAGGNGNLCRADCTVCGDQIVDAGEQCDDGDGDNGNDCRNDCTIPVCGDGIVDPQDGEQCDDGNTTDGDGCQGNCQLPFCGDGIVDPDEDCDDANAVDGDGCDSNCTLTGCGNGILTDGEQCDDGNNVDGDGCQSDCQLPFCGDGIDDAGEECDDGNNFDGDGCSAACVSEGACCSDGPGTQSECLVSTEEVCAANGNSALFLGDGTNCAADIDCVALSVEMESMSAKRTPDGVLLTWTTAMELDTVAFRVLRETPSASGSREKAIVVVAERVATIGNPLEGARYVFLDNAKESALATNYYLEDVDIFGRVTRHGPIVIDRGGRQAPRTRRTR